MRTFSTILALTDKITKINRLILDFWFLTKAHSTIIFLIFERNAQSIKHYSEKVYSCLHEKNRHRKKANSK